jgi:diaminopimelate epimerase
MSTLEFAKYEGLGNDFVVIDAQRRTAVDPQLARRLCDRHFGVGADGVLLVTPTSSAEALARMTVINADGTRAEMCGNGLRCVALHLARRDQRSELSFVVETDAGPRACEVERHDDIAQVAIDLGEAAQLGEHVAVLDGKQQVFSRVSMGNPHAVTFDARFGELEIDRFGPEVSAGLPGGSNVEFAVVQEPHVIDLIVWERGVGRTLACGTGAAATVVAAAVGKRVPFDEPVEVRLPGGPLLIAVTREKLAVSLRGPARRVYTGEVTGW